MNKMLLTKMVRTTIAVIFILGTILGPVPYSASAQETLPWRDDFNGPLAEVWDWVYENPDEWSLTEKGYLRIYASPYGTGDENLLLRPVDLDQKDFTIETSLLFNPDTNFQFAGLVLWQDEGNFLQLGRAFCSYEGPCVGNGIYFDKILGGYNADSNFATVLDAPSWTYLRLVHRGDYTFAYYSADRVAWTFMGGHAVPKGFTVNAIGLTSSQDFNTPDLDIPADFDYFELSEGPLSPVEIRWFVGLGTGSDPSQLPTQLKVVEDFNASHPGIHLTLEVYPNDQARDILAGQIAEGNPPDIVGPVGWGGSNSFHDEWLDLNPLISSTGYDTSIFDPELYAMYQTDIGQEGLPFAVYPSAIYYNPALFDAAGVNDPPAKYGEQYSMPDGHPVDWNWDTVAEVSKLLTLDSTGRNATDPDFDPNHIVQYGFSFGWQSPPNHSGSYWDSGTMLEGSGPYTAKAPTAWKDAWHWIYDGIWGAQPYYPGGDSGYNRFNDETVAMVESPSWFTCCNTKFTDSGGTFQFAAMPSYDGVVAGRIDADTFRILKGSHHPEEAFEVLTYLVGPEGVDTLLIGSEEIAPAYSAVSALTGMQGEFVAAQSAQFQFVTPESWDVLLEGLNYPDVPSAEGWTPNYDDASNRGNEFRDMLYGESAINLDYEFACYENNLEFIFNGQPMIECRHPRFDVRANNDQIEAWEWMIGDELTLTINGEYFSPLTVGGAPWDPNTSYVQFRLGEGDSPTNILPGDVVTLSNGLVTKTTVVTDLSFTDIDIDLDMVEGMGSPDAQVDVWACDAQGCSNRHDTPDDSHIWSADFRVPGEYDNEKTLFDIVGNTWIDSQQVDNDGDKSMYGLNTPSFVVFPEREWFDGNNWPAGNTVTITVQGKPECSVSPVSPGNFFNGSFGENCNIETGNVVTFSNGDTTLTHTVKKLGITEVNAEENIVSGTADTGAMVTVWPHATGQQIQVTAEDDSWQVDFTDEFDIKPNDCGRSEIRDELGLATAVDWCAPAPPRIYAGLTDDSIRYEYSDPMATVTFSIFDVPDGNLLWEGSKLADSSGSAWVSIWEHYVDLVPGTFIRVTDGVHTNELVVEQISIDLVNADENILSGKALEGRPVWVVANNEPDRCGTTVEAGPDDTWQVGFDDLVCDITSDMVFYAQVMDDEQDTSEANPGFIDGWHDGTEGVGHANSCNAYGWAVDSDDRNRDIQVRILSDGEEIASTLANNAIDLFGVCGADGSCGFNVNLWGLVSTYQEHQITAQAYDQETGQWKDLYATPKSLTCVNYDIYVLNVKTGEVERLTTLEDTGEYNPSWSPNGNKIVHDVSDANFHALYITDIKTHVSTPLAGGENGNEAAWSPNGKWIAFDRRWAADANLYLLPPIGGTPTLVVSDAVSGDWSPNSQFLVFERNGSLWTASIASGVEHQIAFEGYDPVWSPNGMWVAYDLNGDLWKVRVDRFGARIGEPIQLTSGPANEGGPSWSQNGREIAFVSDASGDFDLWKISANGGAPRQLRGAIGYGDYDADHSNNGQYIAYEGAMEPSLPHIESDAWLDSYALVDWPAGQSITITIDDPATGRYPEYRTTFTPDGSTNYYLQFPGIDLKPGLILRARSNYFTKTLRISKLAATTIDAAIGRVSGVATPNATFFMWTDGDHFQLPIGQDVPVDVYGKWQVDYGASAPLPWTWYTGGEMSEWDSDGDMTHARWHVHQEVVEAWLPHNEIRAFDWPRDTLLTFTVYENGLEIYSGTAPTFPLSWMDGTEAVITTNFTLTDGMRVVVTDGVTTKETIVKAIQITDANVDTDVVTGYGPVGANLELISWEDSPFSRFFTPEDDDSWSIDYRTPSINGVTVDINPGDSFILFVRDPEKDSTVYEYVVPYPELLVPRE